MKSVTQIRFDEGDDDELENTLNNISIDRAGNGYIVTISTDDEETVNVFQDNDNQALLDFLKLELGIN